MTRIPDLLHAEIDRINSDDIPKDAFKLCIGGPNARAMAERIKRHVFHVGHISDEIEGDHRLASFTTTYNGETFTVTVAPKTQRRAA